MRSKFLVGCLLASSLLSAPALAQSPPQPNNPPAATSPSIAHSGQWRASKMIGVNVYNEQNEKLGDINEVLVEKSGKVSGVVVGVGGFLGMGEHDILVSLDKIKFVNEPMRTSASSSNTQPTPNSSRSNTTGSATNAPATAVRNANEKWYPDHAVMTGNKDQLKAMPQFKYSTYN